MFVLVVPQIVGLYQKLAKALVSWEDHPTHIGEEKSLTAKTLSVSLAIRPCSHLTIAQRGQCDRSVSWPLPLRVSLLISAMYRR